MKTFFLNIPKRLKLHDQKLDVQAAICDKAWSVFNDEGVKQLFIFQTNGTLIISTNGIVSYSKWEYIPVNQSIIINSENKSIMFLPTFMDDCIFALQQDGEGGPCLILINQQNQQRVSAETLADLEIYFSRIIDSPGELPPHDKEAQDTLIQVTRKHARRVNDEISYGEIHFFEEKINGLFLHRRNEEDNSECWYEYFGERCSDIYKSASSVCYEVVLPIDDTFLILTSNKYDKLLLSNWDVFFEHATNVTAYTQNEFERLFPYGSYKHPYEWDGDGYPFGDIYLLSDFGYNVRNFVVIDSSKAVYYRMSIENYSSSLKQSFLGYRGKITTYKIGERKDWVIRCL